METLLSLKNLCFAYNETQKIIEDFNLDVEKGSFTTLLGESGSGKTTLLKLISGFLSPTSGSIRISGVEQKEIEPNKRKIGIVFQDYALFPHFTVMQNIAYGLKLKKISKKEINEQVIDFARNLSLENYLDRFPHELSGGQQQRVALARALVLKPDLLLMDEPLSSLDAKLREHVREELKEIQQNLHITTVYVTHDQTEALSLSDKIAVLNSGKLLQYASPRDLYFKPGDSYTADFIGTANFIETVEGKFMLRPEWFSLNKSVEEGDLFGIVKNFSFMGDRTRFYIQLDNGNIILADLPTLESLSLNVGQPVSLNITHKWQIK